MVHDRSLEFSVCLGGAKISRIQVINRSLTISLGFGLGNIPKILMLLTSTEHPVARTCKNLQSDLNIFKCLKCPPQVEMIILGRWCNSDQFCYIMKPGVCLTNCLDPNNPTRYPSNTGRPWREVERSLKNASVFMIQTHSKRSDWWWLNQPLGEKIAQVKLDHFPQVGVKMKHI